MKEKPDPKAKPARDPDSFFIKLPGAPQVGTAEAQRQERELLERLRRKGPRAETLKPLVIFYSRVGQQETAYRYLKTWMKHSKQPEELSECLLMSGQLAEQVGQVQAAAAFYREGLELKPEAVAVNYFLHNNLAFCLNSLFEYEAAASHCHKAIEYDPSRANAYKNLGASYHGLGQYAQAAAMWLKALHIDVSDGRPLELLENLLTAQLEAVQREIPDVQEQLTECRHAVQSAKGGRFADWARGLTFN